MKRFVGICLFCMLLLSWAVPAWCNNPFAAKPETLQAAPEPHFKSRFFTKIAVWQHQLKQSMSDLVRAFKNDDRTGSLFLLLGVAFAYGAIHAAGPGHGKLVAMSYVLSHRPTVVGGIVLGFCIALIHGFSGVVGVLGLRYVIQCSVSRTLTSVTEVTQMASFGLIAVLGFGMLLKHAWALFSQSKAQFAAKEASMPAVRKNIWLWALAVGIMPCPAVLMTMLFCLSMDVVLLGLMMALFISLGMGGTISLVVTTMNLGKNGVLQRLPQKRLRVVEAVVGMISGAAIAVFGVLFFIPAVNSALCGYS
ncbi:MAG: hypothetical protein CR984_02265 [Proteobacteria bacterium]|nr:MAG: hypothetical protein CR984_02265 [Pseudomonadota bacterium]PIE67841.1 MAG: hypothetical protein CSA23_01810 [Deltaproteobacteria bacterium]